MNAHRMRRRWDCAKCRGPDGTPEQVSFLEDPHAIVASMLEQLQIITHAGNILPSSLTLNVMVDHGARRHMPTPTAGLQAKLH